MSAQNFRFFAPSDLNRSLWARRTWKEEQTLGMELSGRLVESLRVLCREQKHEEVLSRIVYTLHCKATIIRLKSKGEQII